MLFLHWVANRLSPFSIRKAPPCQRAALSIRCPPTCGIWGGHSTRRFQSWGIFGPLFRPCYPCSAMQQRRVRLHMPRRLPKWLRHGAPSGPKPLRKQKPAGMRPPSCRVWRHGRPCGPSGRMWRLWMRPLRHHLMSGFFWKVHGPASILFCAAVRWAGECPRLSVPLWGWGGTGLCLWSGMEPHFIPRRPSGPPRMKNFLSRSW